nr:PREDICTED: lebercilin-like protein [Lepisosteus oculatus]XP_015196883.1 PREDICTED: lebercilin-like protein [Lepisosteus oculatus]
MSLRNPGGEMEGSPENEGARGDGAMVSYRPEFSSPEEYSPIRTSASVCTGSSSPQKGLGGASCEPDYSDDCEPEDSQESDRASSTLTSPSPRRQQGVERGPRRAHSLKAQSKPALRRARRWIAVPSHKARSLSHVQACGQPPRRGPSQRIMSARLHRIKELSSQVWDLQQQLNATLLENRLLKRLQGRHTAALRRFQDSQNCLPQMIAKHSGEVRALREQLRRSQEHGLAVSRKLRAAEAELLRIRDALQRLEQLAQDRSLEERDQLTHKLGRLSLDIELKTRRIQELEKKLKLNSAAFTRHLAAESRKTLEARDLTKFLQMEINHLSQKIQEKERELEIHNIYAHRVRKGCHKKVTKESRWVQTEQLCLPAASPCFRAETEDGSVEQQELDQVCLAISYTETHEISLTETLEESKGDRSPDREETGHSSAQEEEESSDTEEEVGVNTEMEDGGGFLNGLPEPAEAGKAEEAAQAEPADHEDGDLLLDLEDFLSSACKSSSHCGSPARGRRLYRFKETVQNLHHGRPAYGTPTPAARRSPRTRGRRQPELDDLGLGGYEPSFAKPPAGLSQGGGRPEAEAASARSRKSCLMDELFGQRTPAEGTGTRRGRGRDTGPHGGATATAPCRTQGETKSPGRTGAPTSSCSPPFSFDWN